MITEEEFWAKFTAEVERLKSDPIMWTEYMRELEEWVNAPAGRPKEPMFVNATVISAPGAAIETTVYELSESARQGLTVGDVKLPSCSTKDGER